MIAATRPRVVIVGGGFGGLACARALDGTPIDVLLIDGHNYHLFTPLLYQVATALLNPSDIVYPFRTIFRRSSNVRFRQAFATRVDFDARVIHTRDDEQIPYDHVVLASGSTNNYYGNPDLSRFTIGMKTIPEALRLRNHVLSCLELAARETDIANKRTWLTFIVAGGGPTGVEYSGALAELLKLVLGRDFPELQPRLARIILVEGTDRLLGHFSPELGAYAERILAKRGIEVRTSTLLQKADEASVTLSTGDVIEARTVVWSAGVRATEPTANDRLRRSRSHRLEVDQFLRVKGVDRVYAIGDLASVPSQGGELPMLSPPAMQGGRYVARAILDCARGRQTVSLRPFRYVDKGAMATVGRNAAVAQTGPLRLSGFIGWLTWLVVHIYYLIGFRNRMAVLASWAWNYIRKDRSIRIIARSEADALTEELETGRGTPPREARGRGT
jgi:NADH:ubiquinone reductase (H+-translocating)